jgi:hypothetical protein
MTLPSYWQPHSGPPGLEDSADPLFHSRWVRVRTAALDEQFCRDSKVFGQLLNLGLADGALAVHKIRHMGTRAEHRNKICLL